MSPKAHAEDHTFFSEAVEAKHCKKSRPRCERPYSKDSCQSYFAGVYLPGPVDGSTAMPEFGHIPMSCQGVLPDFARSCLASQLDATSTARVKIFSNMGTPQDLGDTWKLGGDHGSGMMERLPCVSNIHRSPISGKVNSTRTMRVLRLTRVRCCTMLPAVSDRPLSSSHSTSRFSTSFACVFQPLAASERVSKTSDPKP